jgi:Uma2 family endonuclease
VFDVHHATTAQPRAAKAEYYHLGKAGFFQGQKVELIEGRLMVTSPQDPDHALTLDVMADLLSAAFGASHWVRRQYPLDIGQTTEPEPDVSVIFGDRRQFRTSHPTSAVLIVEVSGSTLSYYRRHKGSLYARAGIQDYWVVNLRRRWIEVYRAPIPDADRPFGHRYSSRQDFLPGASLSPLAAPTALIAVSDVLT